MLFNRFMMSYIWPKENKEVRRRVKYSLGLLLTAKVLNVQVSLLEDHAAD